MNEGHVVAENEVKFIFADEEEKALGIETAEYPNGNQVKKVKLSTGKIALIRELTGRDMKRAEDMAGGKKENVLTSIMALATKIDGREIPMEDYDDMKGRDYNKIKYAATMLNF